MTRFRHSGGLASLTKRVWPKRIQVSARCAWRTALMKFTIVPLHAWSCANMPTRRFHSLADGHVAHGIKRDDEYAGVKTVEERHRIDEASLDRWMRRNIDGYLGELTVHQFKGGQSNPTYQLNTRGASCVLRRKPFGKLL